MPGRKFVIGLAAFLAIAVFVVAIMAVQGKFQLRQSAVSPAESALIDLGFTYIPINQQTAPCYGLNPDDGVLVTAVASGSLADQAGLKEGDFIVGFNGIYLNDKTPLLGLIRDCPQDSAITMSILHRGADQNGDLQPGTDLAAPRTQFLLVCPNTGQGGE